MSSIIDGIIKVRRLKEYNSEGRELCIATLMNVEYDALLWMHDVTGQSHVYIPELDKTFIIGEPFTNN